MRTAQDIGKSVLDGRQHSAEPRSASALAASLIVTVAVMPETSATPAGTASIAMRTAARYARVTTYKQGRRWTIPAPAPASDTPMPRVTLAKAYASATLAEPLIPQPLTVADNVRTG
jgi:hypothetical protein